MFEASPVRESYTLTTLWELDPRAKLHKAKPVTKLPEVENKQNNIKYELLVK